MKRAANEIPLGKLRRNRKPYIRRSPAAERSMDGQTFDSKAELVRYRELKALRSAEKVAWFLRRPRFDLAGAVYHGDFLVAWQEPYWEPDCQEVLVTIEEVKGRGTHPEVLRRFRRNAAQVRQLYGLEVELIER